ncbi:MAG TPA: DNA polymerase III subunit delta' [Anaerolineales bacterium]|nr:DNA polymerase III subunit delta' [Anaerolineales bacterium]
MGWDLIGHAWAVALLRRQMQRGSLHHAYLFSGPEGVGRRRLAMAFAQALLCESPPEPGETCGACRGCRQVPQEAYPDLHMVARSEDKQGLAVDQIRDLQRQLALAPLAGSRRVAVLLDVDRASLGAANALLKTLEEPPPRVILLLTAVDVEQMPATIVSRCESLLLRPVATGEIAAELQRLGASSEEARTWAQQSAGRPEWGRALMDDPEFRQRLAEHATAYHEVLSADLGRRFALADSWKDDTQLEERLSVWISLAGENLRELTRASGEGEADHDELGRVAQGRRTMDALIRTLDGLRHNVNTRLALEGMMLELPRSP